MVLKNILEDVNMYKLVLIRHGESVWNKENKFTGWTDVDLSQKGVQEAIKAGQQLKKDGFTFDLAYTSVLKRAIKTLNNVLEQMDELWIPVKRSWRLNERHYGSLQGLNKAETAAKFGEAQVKIWSLTECLKDTVARVLPLWKEEIAPNIKTGKKIVIAAHGNSLRALVKYLDNISDEDIVNLNIPTAMPLVYELDENLKPIKSYYIGDPEAVKKAMEAVANQGKVK